MANATNPNTSAEQREDDAALLTFSYCNYRGEVAERRVRPISVRWGSTEWHPEPQWLMLALDLDKGAEREFAMRDMVAPPSIAEAECRGEARGMARAEAEARRYAEMYKPYSDGRNTFVIFADWCDRVAAAELPARAAAPLTPVGELTEACPECHGKGCWHDCHGEHGDCTAIDGCSDCSVRCEACQGNGVAIAAPSTRHTVWLLERPENDNSPARWWNPEPNKGWMIDARKALWFSRKQDALALMRGSKFGGGVIATEHVFIDGVVAAQPGAGDCGPPSTSTLPNGTEVRHAGSSTWLADEFAATATDNGKATEVLRQIKLLCLTMGAAGQISVADGLARIVRICRDAGITETLSVLRTAKPSADDRWRRCPSTHCERRQECASPNDCMVKPRVGTDAELTNILQQAIDCINDETPEDMTREEARENTVERLRAALAAREVQS